MSYLRIRKAGKINVKNILSKYEKLKKKRGNPGGKNKRYLDCVCAFDVETSTIWEVEQSFVYLWQFSFNNDFVIYGRTIEEYRIFCEQMKEYLLKKKMYLVIYVHNLAYEIQFLSGIYDFGEDEIFAVKNRKVIKAEMHNCLEYRCSYALCNMGLGAYLDDRKTKHRKLDGEEFDYNKFRTPKTILTKSELRYAFNDVIGLVEAIKKDMEQENDNLYTIPLTSTGYLRREIKKAVREQARNEVKASIPSYEVYKIARKAFTGGDTHANRYYSCKELEHIHSIDESSAYPYAICCLKYPKGEWYKIENPSKDDLLRKLKSNRAILMTIVYKNIKVKDEFPDPVISKSKCGAFYKITEDNGRIYEAQYIKLSITDIDFKIIEDSYTYEDYAVPEMFFCGYGNQPQCIKDIIIKYYKNKTSLKGLTDDKTLMLYALSKSKINSAYGLEAQDPMKDDIKYIDGKYVVTPVDESEYKKRASKGLPYTWGVWVTANARMMLHEIIKEAGADKSIYWDTDSLKYCGEVDCEKINDERKEKAIKNGLYAYDIKDAAHYGGVFEYEGCYDKFKTMGAKKYVVEENGKLKVTISGVNKKKGGEELEEKGGIKSFDEGFTFEEAGGTSILYNDEPPITEYEYKGEKIKISKNAVIRPSTYTVGLMQEYKNLLNEIIERM